MKKADRTSTRTSRAKIENFGVIALRLPAAELERTLKHADRGPRPAQRATSRAAST